MLEGYQKTYITAKISPVFTGENFKTVASKKYEKCQMFRFLSPDITPVNIILASEHEKQLNGDYFFQEMINKSCKTPIHKPFNIDTRMSEDESIFLTIL